MPAADWRASATVSRRNLEFDMKTRWNSLLVGGCNVVGLILLVLSVSVGGSAVRAAGDSAVLDSVALEPLMKLADVFQQRIAKIEASVTAVTQSLTTKRVAAQELCVADETGAQTCITKAQLDALLKGARQTAQAAPMPPQAAPAPASPAAQMACPEKCVAPDAIAAPAASETPSAAEPTAVKEMTATAKETSAAKEPVLPESAGAGASESALPEASALPVVKETAAEETAVPEGAAPTVPPATLQARPAETKAVESVIATAAKPETLEPPAKPEEPAQTGPATTGSAAQEPKAVPAEAPAVSEHKE
jgi:hypothetical protein